MQGRQAAGQFGIENNEIGVELTGNDAHLRGFTGRQNGDVRDFRSGSSCGRDLNQRKTTALHLADTIQFGKFLFGDKQHCCELGDIHGRPAAQTEHDVATSGLCLLDAGKQHGFRRIGHHVIENADTETSFLQRCQCMVENACLV